MVVFIRNLYIYYINSIIMSGEIMGKNYYSTNNKKVNVQLNIEAVYHSINGPNYLNVFNNGNTVVKEDFYGAIHVIRGEGTIKTKNQDYLLQKDDLLFLKYSDVISLSTVDCEWEYYFLWFYLVNLDLPFYQIFNIKQSEKDDEMIYSIIRLLSFDNYYTIGQANALCQVVLFRWLESSNSTLKFSEVQYKTIKEAVYYINQNLDQKIRVSDLAAKFNFSEKHFRNLFIRATGMSPKRYILNSKLDRATYLLTHSTKQLRRLRRNSVFPKRSFNNCFLEEV